MVGRATFAREREQIDAVHATARPPRMRQRDRRPLEVLEQGPREALGRRAEAVDRVGGADGEGDAPRQRGLPRRDLGQPRPDQPERAVGGRVLEHGAREPPAERALGTDQHRQGRRALHRDGRAREPLDHLVDPVEVLGRLGHRLLDPRQLRPRERPHRVHHAADGRGRPQRRLDAGQLDRDAHGAASLGVSG